MSIGRLIEYKGFHHLIDACSLLQQRGCPFACDIVGDGPWREQLQTQIDRLNLGDAVRLIGHQTQEQVRRHLQAADVFALHSIVDPGGGSDMAPTVIMEAMAIGRPVVSTRLVGIPELVQDGTTGWLVDPGDTTSFADRLAHLLASPSLRHTFGDNARHRIESCFDAHQTAARLIPHFEASLQHPAHRSSLSLHDSPLPPPAEPNTARPPVAYLLDRYQVHHTRTRWLFEELTTLRRHWPALPVFVITETTHLPPLASDEEANLLGSFHYLPHATVVEAAWHRERRVAHQLEDALFDLRLSAIPSHEQFTAARLALALAPRLAEQRVRHLHAVGPTAHITACVLRKAGLVSSISARLDFPFPHGDLAARQIAGPCIGGHFAGKRPRQPPAHFLPAPPHPAPPGPLAWVAQLDAWARGA